MISEINFFCENQRMVKLSFHKTMKFDENHTFMIFFLKKKVTILSLQQISSYTFDCFLKKRGKKLINADFYIGGNYPKICTFRHEKKIANNTASHFPRLKFFSISNIGIFHTFLLNESRCTILKKKCYINSRNNCNSRQDFLSVLAVFSK